MDEQTSSEQKPAPVEHSSDASPKVQDDSDVTKRRVINDYTAYNPVSIEPGNEHGRLMQILRPEKDGDEDEDIVCALFDAPPTFDNIVYIALSYCWGSMTEQRTISLIHHGVDESEVMKEEDEKLGETTKFMIDRDTKRSFNVTESLYQALKSIRKAIPRLQEQFPILDFQPLWVDAVCINQNDTNERNSQVGLMGSIYSKAWFVFIWLGEGEQIMQGLNLIQAMVNLLHDTWGSALNIINPDEDHLITLLNAKYKLDEDMLDPESCFQILERLFAHPYFKRIWVLQEATINAESTWIHVTQASVPWTWIIVADRFRQLWRRIYPTVDNGRLPLVWGHLLQSRLMQARKVRTEQSRGLNESDRLGLRVPLYMLFINTYEEFAATDLRDKLYALLDLAIETRPGTMARRMLAPDYTKTISEVFSKFTIWCIQSQGDLEVLSLLSGGPRRLLPEEIADLVKSDRSLPQPYVNATEHPSWAFWPTTGGYWSQTSLTKVNNKRETKFDLASNKEVSLFNLATHPIIKLPKELAGRFLSLGGRRIGVVKSIVRVPLRCFASNPDKNSFLKAKWATDEMQQDMEKHAKSYKLHLTDPYREGALLDGGLAPLWHYIKKERTDGTIIGDGIVEVLSQEWLGRDGSRYQGKQELMFRDFLETLLLSPVYRGLAPDENDSGQDGEILEGPWNDPEIATSFAMFWAENDPHFIYPPPRIGKYLRTQMFERGIAREKQFPFLFLGHGKCFFITEDERMGLCSPDARPGDLVVGLHGARVPFVIRPAKNEENTEAAQWTFEGHERLQKKMFRFAGECYLHERMASSFFDDEEVNQEEMEVFNLH